MLKIDIREQELRALLKMLDKFVAAVDDPKERAALMALRRRLELGQ